MIDWLQVSKSAYFFRERKPLTKSAIDELFRTIRKSHGARSNNLFSHNREAHGAAHWSALSFYFERPPVFLNLPAGHDQERICGFILLVEYRGYVAFFKAGLDLPSAFKSEFLERAEPDRVEKAIAQASATFEKIRLRNMSVSRYALRYKTLEAADLQGVLGPAGTRRFVPQGYRVRVGAEHYTATPNTGRVTERSDRLGHIELIAWSQLVVDRMSSASETSPFIRNFARAAELGALPKGTVPSCFAVDVPALTDELFESDEPMVLVRGTGAAAAKIGKKHTLNILNALDRAFDVGADLRLLDAAGKAVGSLHQGKTRISLRALDIAEIDNVYIQPAAKPLGAADAMPLKQHIDRSDVFTVLFSDATLAYLNGSLYRDEQFADGGGTFLSYFRSAAGLADAVSEKGTFAATQKAFSADSTFGEIANAFAQDNDVLVCDDLGDEWADFIGLCVGSTPKSISFYHAKHGDLSLSASAFHVSVSQAIKNLGRMVLEPEAVKKKSSGWMKDYKGEGVQTKISRLQKGSKRQLDAAITAVRNAPDTIRRVFIVTSSLSLGVLQGELDAIKGGEAPKPHFVQLYWLLMGYFSACAEVGANGYVVCQP